MSALLLLSDARVAQETRHAEVVAVAEAEWRRGVLAFASLALTGDTAQIALWGGLLLSNAGPLVFGYGFWMREQGNWEG